MNIEYIYEKLGGVLSEDAVLKRGTLLSGYTTFRTGGPADVLVEPASEADLAAVLGALREENAPYIVLGNGSNVLVRDEGFRGVVVVIGAGLGGVEVDEGNAVVRAGAGAMLGEVARAAARGSLSGLEFASGIPGSLGGGVFMNAGAYGGEMAQVVMSVRALMPDGRVCEFKADELDFAYRHSVFTKNGGVILSAVMQLEKGDAAQINETMKDLNRRRVEKQPLNYPSAGSTFKRPEGYFAGKLIQDAGCKGLSVGGALVSQKHSGFIVNTGNATSQDILDLIKLVQLRVKEEFGVDLETEVRII